MLTVVAKLKVRAGKEGEAEKALREMIEYVGKSEPATKRYVLHRSSGDPTQMLMYEQYESQEAMNTHSGSAAIQKLFGVLGPILDGPASIETYEEVAGKK